MGRNQKNERGSNQEANRRSEEICYNEVIDRLYDEGIRVGLLFKDMYSMDIYELENTIDYRRRGKAYDIWRLASFTRSPFVKQFPNSPEEACPELFPKKPSIPMPDFLKDKILREENK